MEDYDLLLRAGVRSITSGVTKTIDGQLPQAFELSRTYPNPFNGSTRFLLRVDQPGHYLITVSDLAGRSIATIFNGQLDSGQYQFKWDGRDRYGADLPSGMYVIQAGSGSLIRNSRTILLR